MKLRLASLEDSTQIAEIYAPIVENTAISFELVPPSADEMASRIATVLRDHAWLVADNDGVVEGYAYAGKHRERAAYGWSTDTTIYVRDIARGRGVGRKLYQALLRILDAQNYQIAFAGIALPNSASIALHESVGFTHLGTYPTVGFKFDKWHDVGWWFRHLNSKSESAQQRIPVQELGDISGILNR